MREIYLDNNASTALDPRVHAAMNTWLDQVGNASSGHQFGRRAQAAVSVAREQVADLLRAAPRDIIFTSGATEANNLAITGLAATAQERRRLVSVATEHPSVLEPLRALARSGFELVLLPVDRNGLVDLDDVRAHINGRTLLVSVMSANNETGVLAPLAEIACIARAAGALVHTDASQLLAWGRLDVDQMDVDLLSLSSHKMHGPQGVGALYVRRGTPIGALFHGGGHERGLRSGTANTAGNVALGLAAQLAADEGPAAAARTQILRDDLHRRFAVAAPPVELNGHVNPRLPGTLNVAFPDADSDAVIAGAPTVAVATGSACSTGHPGPSHVLSAMGISAERAATSLRFGLSRMTTQEDVDIAASSIVASVRIARQRAAVQIAAS